MSSSNMASRVHQFHNRFQTPEDASAAAPAPVADAADKSLVEAHLVDFQGLNRDFAAGLKFPGSGDQSSNSINTPSTTTTASTAPSTQSLSASDMYPEFSSFDTNPTFPKEKPFANINFGATPSQTSAATSAASSAVQSPAMRSTNGTAYVNGGQPPKQSVGAFSADSVQSTSIAPSFSNMSIARQSGDVARLEAAAEAASVDLHEQGRGSHSSAPEVPSYGLVTMPSTAESNYGGPGEYADAGPVSSASYYLASSTSSAEPLSRDSIPFTGASWPLPQPGPHATGMPTMPPQDLLATKSAGIAHPSELPNADDDYESPFPEGSGQRTRPNSFFGINNGQSDAATAGAAGRTRTPLGAYATPDTGSSMGGCASALDNDSAMTGGAIGGRPSSFFGGTDLGGPLPGTETVSRDGQTQSARIAAYHRGETLNSTTNDDETNRWGVRRGNNMPPPINTNASNIPNTSSAHTPTGPANDRPRSIAPANPAGALLNHSHLKPGQQAALLSHGKTLELYRQNARKTNDPNLIYEFSVFMIDASNTMGMVEGGGEGAPAAGQEAAKEDLIKEALGLLKKVADRGHADSQYFLADCYANGIGTPGGKQAFDKAYPLFILAAKHGHPDAAYRAGTCQEKGWGCRKDNAKALQFYRKAASQGHPGAMYRLATAELNGELGLKKSAKEGVKWLKRSAEAATPEFPHALHELALLHERGVDNVVFVDPEYSCELLAQSAEMGYAPSAYKLGVNYEYGRMGCPQDGGLSIHMYNIAAQQNHKEACFALTAWYLVGAPGILPQSDTEAYLWAKKAAEQGLAKAEYAVGYFTEMGIGTVKDLRDAKSWYKLAAEHGDRRANQRIGALSRMSASGLGPAAKRASQQVPLPAPPVEQRPSQPRNFDPRLSQWIGDPDAADRRKHAGFRAHRQDSQDSFVGPSATSPGGSRPMSMATDAYSSFAPAPMYSQQMPMHRSRQSFSAAPPGAALPAGLHPQMQAGVPGGPLSPRDKEEARMQQRLALLHKQEAQQASPQQQHRQQMLPSSYPMAPHAGNAMGNRQMPTPPPSQQPQAAEAGNPTQKKKSWFK
ncbi:hypothetical protein K437DRAFT_35975 [Tilletiaria anomala UBC 951]|uniref:HCP-like protein n=1 Tax=Tilletiaria anomala (strain ATCC 24038 / CBS 436.72 / UBC 951) TaxID=1037660 RepID=A0A066VGF6_TILAU|nr:uncharacterized protein K437DRAFT_35975 [Tilletiaria anomala UBC 951]KDN37675.1 hypothetical protein K437DRAFT_35975 [Tilletiaria anomala UBC 951]